MQAATGSGPVTGTTTNTSFGKANRLLAAGVTLAAAGVIAANPTTPALPDPQQYPVQLSSAFDTTADNLGNLVAAITANPLPIANALGELATYYAQVAGGSIEGSLNGIVGIWSGMGAAKGLEHILPLVTDYIQHGNVTDAWNLINSDMLFDMANVFQPLFTRIPHGGTESVDGLFGIGGSLTHDFANLQALFGDFSLYKSAANSFMSPFIGLAFALSDNLSGVRDAQNPLDALLNGYVPWAAPDGSDADPSAALLGLLSARGPIGYLAVTFPGKIADALTQGLPNDEAGAASAAAAEAAGSAGGDLTTTDPATTGLAATDLAATDLAATDLATADLAVAELPVAELLG